MSDVKDPRLNYMVISGRLTRDPEKRHLGNSSLLTINLVHTERYKKGDEWQEKPVYIDVKVWGKSADYLAEKLTKGTIVLCQGRIFMDSWENKEGKTVNKLVMSAHQVESMQWDKGASSKNEDDDMVF